MTDFFRVPDLTGKDLLINAGNITAIYPITRKQGSDGGLQVEVSAVDIRFVAGDAIAAAIAFEDLAAQLCGSNRFSSAQAQA